MRPFQLRTRRKRLQLNQAEAAELLRTTERNYQRWESGDTPVPALVEDFFDAMDTGWLPRRLRDVPVAAMIGEGGRA